MTAPVEKPSIYSIRRSRPAFFEVVNRLTGEVNEVKVNRGRYVGPCTCRAERLSPLDKCEHQEAVRRHLMNNTWKPLFAAHPTR